MLGTWQHFAVSAIGLLVVFSLFLSWMGPMLDHHFAERHPGHQHIYLGAASPEHPHDFQSLHSHNSLHSLLTASQTAPKTVDGIVSLTPASGSAFSVADITVPASAQSIGFGMEGGSALLGYHMRSETIPPGATVAPPRHPPRA